MSNMQQLTEEVVRIAAYIKANCKHNESLNPIVIPITEIDGIPVKVKFTYEGKVVDKVQVIHYIACRVYLAPNIEYTMAEFTVRDFDEEFTLEKGVMLLLKKINTLRFNKMIGLIQSIPKSDNDSVLDRPDLMTDLYNIIKTFENVKLSIIECSVCFEMTKTSTSCNHQLCISCYSKLEVVKEGWCEDSGQITHMKKCPLCRGVITKILPETEIGELNEHLVLELYDDGSEREEH